MAVMLSGPGFQLVIKDSDWRALLDIGRAYGWNPERPDYTPTAEPFLLSDADARAFGDGITAGMQDVLGGRRNDTTAYFIGRKEEEVLQECALVFDWGAFRVDRVGDQLLREGGA